MAFDAFLKIDGIKGESTDKEHKDEIDLISFSWGETNAGRAFGGGGIGGGGGGGGAGRVTFQDFHFTHKVDKATPLLFFACASGQHIATATLTCRRPGSPGITAAAPDAPVPAPRPGEFLIYVMTNVLVSSFSDAGVSADEDRPVESISLNFTQLQIEYTPQNADGANGTPITRGWDVRANKKV
jgi:type VI secretion system secreted protein Hcp